MESQRIPNFKDGNPLLMKLNSQLWLEILGKTVEEALKQKRYLQWIIGRN